WRGLSLHPEARRRFDQARSALAPTVPVALAARLWEGIAQLSGETASPESRAAALQAAALYRQLDDRRGLYLSLAHLAFSYRANSAQAEAAYAEMQRLEDGSWPPSLRLYGRKVEGGLASDAGRLDAARAANEARLALGIAAGSERDVNAALGNLAEIALMAGDAERSVELGRQLLARLGQRHRTTRVIALGNLLPALLTLQATAAARAVLAEYVDLARHFDSVYVMYASDSMAWLAAAEGRWDAAAMLIGYSDASYAFQGQAREPNERRAREAAEALIVSSGRGPSLAAATTTGAAMQAADACAVAIQASPAAPLRPGVATDAD
ncbi:MAG: hypothetical protein M3Z16_08260, partial [Pseudomonadota bacterium]|nr:hypothetical protein [Pseudomonadota bacterium]